MVADFALVIALTIPVVIMGFIAGVGFATGIPGILVFMFLSGLWGLIFTGFPYAIALKTGNAAAVNMSFLLFFPFLFMTTLFVPQEAMTGWLGTAADYNPVTYLLAALRSSGLLRLGTAGPSQRTGCHTGSGSCEYRPGLGRPKRPGYPQVGGGWLTAS